MADASRVVCSAALRTDDCTCGEKRDLWLNELQMLLVQFQG